MAKKIKKTKDLPAAPTIKEIAEVSDTGEPQFEDIEPILPEMPAIDPDKHQAFVESQAKAKAVRPWITNVTRADDTGNATIRFHDNTEIVKLGVSFEDYKTFEATFGKKDWQESSLTFLDNELAKYAEA